MIEIYDSRIIHLKGTETSYVMRALQSGQIEHIYYGKRLEKVQESEKAIVEKNFERNPVSIEYSEKYQTTDLNDLSLEASFEGKGDFKTPLVRIKGKRILDFRFSGAKTYAGIKRYKNFTLPLAVKDERDAETVEIELTERHEDIKIILCYTLFRLEDVITRKTFIINNSGKEIEITKCASLQLDLPQSDYTLTALSGAWLRENEIHEYKLTNLKAEISSNVMATGFEHNSTFAITNRRNESIIVGLIYSSDFSSTIEKGANGKVHIVSGISDENFSWILEKDGMFESPEAIICYSEKGLSGASERFKNAVKSIVMRSSWKKRMRPVILSTKDIFSLDVNEDKVIRQAEKAKKLGFEAFILDDGWFSVRRDRESSLGDWYVNPVKFPEGLKMLATRIHRSELLFGLYFDIESVSCRSNLFEEHKDWVIHDESRKNFSSSNEEFLLDFSKEEVQEWAIETLSRIIETARLDYLRYDKSRLPSEILSENDGSLSLRYIMGVYNVLNTVTRKFPSLLLETGFSGGARFDLGMLSYSSLMRATENTDPFERLKTIEGLRLFYPEYATLVTVSGNPDKYTFRNTGLETKFDASIFTGFEYSIDLDKLSKEEEAVLRSQIEFYKMYRETLQFGSITAIESGNRTLWSASSPDKSTIIVLYLAKNAEVNHAKERIYIEDADEKAKYRIYTRSHIRKEDEELDYPGEIECYEAYGDAIKWAGIALSEKTGSGVYSEDMRKITDFSSRLYVIRKVNE